VFVEKAKDGDTSKPIVEIRQNAFSSMQSLKYFEFENTGLRIVQNGGFINCNLEAETLTLHHCPL
jgi:hypothetical protein